MIDNKNNSGHCNSGNSNSGNRNSGNRNSGDWNSGYKNTGYKNTGNSNSGNRNSGNYNSGDWNSGHCNSGNSNSGNRNSGNRNSGDWNSGYKNTGYKNTGNSNSGNRNSGNYNSGDWNSGHFCTETPPVRFFDHDWDGSWGDALALIPIIDLPVGCEWIPAAEMSLKEKKSNPNYSAMGGYLKAHSLRVQEAFPKAWAKMDATTRQRFIDLPHFDAEKFFACTGVDVRKVQTKHHFVVHPARLLNIMWVCDNCDCKINWTYAELAEKGIPVCQNCDSDMRMLE